jgi:hypothetical protein
MSFVDRRGLGAESGGVRRTLVCALLLACTCAKSQPGAPDAGVPDAGPPGEWRAHAEVVSASGRVSAGTRTMDVEVGHWFEHRVTRAGSRTLVGTAVVNP